MSELALFEHAREAISACVSIDEVKSYRNQAQQAKLYARQHGDKKMLADVTEIYARAERRLGELLIEVKRNGGFSVGGRPSNSNLEEPETGDQEEPVFDNTPFTLQEAGISKKLSASSQKLAQLPETAFESAMAKARERILSGGAIVVSPLKDATTAEKKARRVEREQQLGAKQMALPVAKFGVILADPEWQFQPYSIETGMDRAAENHYATSSLDVIKTRDVGSLAADDSTCWLWATVPMLLEGIAVLQTWGFTYKSHLIWNKDRIGMGYWFRNKHELLLVGTRGNVPAPAMGDQFPSVIDAPVGEHSAKPEKFYEIIEAYYPTLPKIELNARVAREGWVRWGYEAPPEPSQIVGAAANLVIVDQIEAGLASGAAVIGVDLSRDAQDEIIRNGYAVNRPLAELVAATGLDLNVIKGRARRMKLSSRDRQREAVVASNKRRAGE